MIEWVLNADTSGAGDVADPTTYVESREAIFPSR